LRHKYLNNQLCEKKSCESNGKKKFIRGISNKIAFPQKNIPLIPFNSENFDYFYDKFMEQIDDFAKTKKVIFTEEKTREEFDLFFQDNKNYYCKYNNITNIDDFMENLKKINAYRDKTFGGIEFTSSADILVELLCENKMALLSLIAQKKIHFTKYYKLWKCQYFCDGIGPLILTMIHLYIIINMLKISNNSIKSKLLEIKDNIYVGDYFFAPILNNFYGKNKRMFDYDKVFQNYEDMELQSNELSKYIFNVLVNIRYMEYLCNDIKSWKQEYSNVISNIFNCEFFIIST
jgi:hypothetical protein